MTTTRTPNTHNGRVTSRTLCVSVEAGLSDHTSVRPPLRWAGSKRATLSSLATLAPREFDRYVEPFAGSAALFFRFAPPAALLGDINEELIGFYRVLAARPHALIRAVSDFAPNGDDYYAVRHVDPRGLTRTAAAARFFYLNRFCFNGVYRTNQRGHFNVPRGQRTGRIPSPEELIEAGRLLRRATLLAADFETTLDAAQPGDFVYIDPPYFTRKGIRPGEYGYDSLGDTGDFQRLIRAVKRLGKRKVKYLLSYSDSPALVKLLQPIWMTRLKVRRSVGGHESHRKTVREMVIANYEPSAEVTNG